MNSSKSIKTSFQNLRLDSSKHSPVKGKAAHFSLLDLRWTKRTSTHPVGCVGLSEKVISWLESHLSERILKASIGKKFLDPGNLTCGIPQGSILDWLLLYVNGMPETAGLFKYV